MTPREALQHAIEYFSQRAMPHGLTASEQWSFTDETREQIAIGLRELQRREPQPERS